MALLHGMCALAAELNITVSAAHFNHQLRGAEAQRDADFVQDYCTSHSIPFFLGHADVSAYAASHSLGIEEAARKKRYEFLLGLDPRAKIATAHTAEDDLETVLMHLIRGSGLHGLTGIPPVRDRIIRPMLAVTRQEITEYLAAHDIPHVEDSTNAEDSCLRNRLRHHVLPLLYQENPNLPRTAVRMTELLRQEDIYLDTLASRFLSEQTDGLSLPQLLQQPEAMRLRILRRFMRDVPQPSAVHLEDALRLCENPSPSARLSLPGGYVLARRYDTLVLLPPTRETCVPETVPLIPDSTVNFGPWQVRCRRASAPEALPANTLALRCPDKPIYLRSRQPGDRISLPGGTKKLSRHLIDLKIPARTRDTLPILALEDEILAVLPHTIAAPWRATSGSDSLILTVKERELTS